MNAKFLERFIVYRENHGLELAKTLINAKIKNQFGIFKKTEISRKYLNEVIKSINIQELLLIEARAAKEYWSLWQVKIKSKIEWKGRIPHSEDPLNRLLDIGYHYLTGEIIKIFNKLEIPTELGIFHRAKSARSHPLVYDFMEWLRPLMVDRTLLAIIGKKKKPITAVDEKLIKYFIFMLKKSLTRYFFHKNLNYCISLEYWITINLLELSGAIKHNQIYTPIFPSVRHKTRCKKPHQDKLDVGGIETA